MHLHVCGMMVVDTRTMPGGYSFELIRAMLCERLPTVRAVRRRLVSAPLHIGRPFWVEEGLLDVDQHLHRVTLRPPGDDRALGELAGEIASWPLRRDRPLWEMWVAEGLADHRIALIAKMHHSTIDGVSGANILGRIFDLEPVHKFAPTAEMLEVPPPSSSLELLGHSLVTRLAEPWDLIRLVPSTAYKLGSMLWQLRKRVGDTEVTTAPFTAPRTSFNGTLTARRCVAFTSVPLVDIKMVKDDAGVTVNDVVTAMVGGALRSYLEVRGELPDRTLIAAAPVSVHDQTDAATGTTRLSVMFSGLATHEKDPVKRLRAVASSNRQAKRINKMVGADSLMRWSQHFWLNAFGLGTRLYSDLHLAEHHPVVHNLILSNVPGPPVPLYLAGARLVGLYPLGPITDGAALNITVLSQGDRVGFGIVGCPDLVPRVWDIADAIPRALDDLVDKISTS